MVNFFSPAEFTTEFLFCLKTMLVGVATNISKMMTDPNPNQYVAARIHHTAATPIRIIGTGAICHDHTGSKLSAKYAAATSH